MVAKFPKGFSLSFFSLRLFLDDLDRCSPAYAIKLLEELKQFFDQTPVLFVIAYDRKQISSTVQAKFGKETDTAGYLRKYFDYNYILPKYNQQIFLSNFIQKASDHIGVDERAKDYLNRVATVFTDDKSLLNARTLRNMQQCFWHITLGLKLDMSVSPNEDLLALLITLKSSEWELYNALYQRQKSGTELCYHLYTKNNFPKILLNKDAFKTLFLCYDYRIENFDFDKASNHFASLKIVDENFKSSYLVPMNGVEPLIQLSYCFQIMEHQKMQ